jgi:hypothetical protein
VAMVDAAEEVPEETARSAAALLLRPTPAEAARTVMEVCVEGTLSTLSEDGWPLGTEIRFALDVDGNPVFSLQPSASHTRNLLSDSRCSLHAQVSFSVSDCGRLCFRLLHHLLSICFWLLLPTFVVAGAGGESSWSNQVDKGRNAHCGVGLQEWMVPSTRRYPNP